MIEGFQIEMTAQQLVAYLRRRAGPRQAALLFLGEHVVANEIYRLDRSDLQFLEMWPRDREEQRS